MRLVPDYHVVYCKLSDLEDKIRDCLSYNDGAFLFQAFYAGRDLCVLIFCFLVDKEGVSYDR